MEELIAQSLRIYEEAGEVGLSGFLAAHPAERDELEVHLGELRAAGLLAPLPEPDDDGSTESDTAGLPRFVGEYELRERIGGGGMGIVFRAWQPSLGREVAVKLLPAERAAIGAARARFRREAEAIARLRHPGIVPVFGFGEEAGLPWLAMELVDGRTLAEQIAALAERRAAALRGADLAGVLGVPVGASPLFSASWNDACLQLGAQIAESLEVAHAAGIVHRDVKPSNVLVDRHGHALLFDFGLALPMQQDVRLTRSGDSVGSPAYMAPEQVRGDPVDARTDVYGLGATLYELLSLELPFAARDPFALREQVLRGEIVPLGHRNPAVSWDAETVVACAMDVDPRRRYASAAALRADLERALAREPIRARRPGPWRRLRRVAARRPARTVALAAVLVLAIGLPTAIGVVQARARVAVDVQRRAAEQHLDTALGALERFVAGFGADELAYTPGLDAAGRALLAEAIPLYDALAAERPGDPRVAVARAEAYARRAAWVDKRTGDLAAARAAGLAALAALPGEVATPGARLQRSLALRTMAAIERARGDLPAARAALVSAVGALDAADPDPELRAARAYARIELGRALTDGGDSRAAEAELVGALAELATAKDAVVTDVPQAHAHALRCLATVRARIGRTAAAIADLRGALAILDARLGGPDAPPAWPAMAAEVLCRLGSALSESGDLAEARAALARGIDIQARLVEEFPSVVQFRDTLVELRLRAASLAADADAAPLLAAAAADAEQLGLAPLARALLCVRIARLRLERDLDGADVEQRLAALVAAVQAVDDLDQVEALDPRDAQELGRALHAIAVVRYQRELGDVEPAARRAVELKRASVAACPDDVEVRESLANSLGVLALLRARGGDRDGALADYAEVIDVREELLRIEPDDHRLQHRLAGTYCNAATTALDAGDPARAIALARRGEQLAAAAVAASPRAAWVRRLADLRATLAEAVERYRD
ncbi:MAG: serine/threonine protein kinase [Planctomycetes bacterium]|nr:serine/threonine protein kinase [Planctomycetota bacterium]